MTNCLFCKIIAGSVPADIVYQDAKYIVFKDINPKAKVHLLLVPKLHVVSLDTIDSSNPEHIAMLSEMLLLLPSIAKQAGLAIGFRTTINTGVGGGQEIDHLHFHLLGGF
ncbi:MAG: histidine triad nucleotide-binding protein [Legionellales bacterium]|nr:MAG: histidine triad nucleotide-binding protein [Legionellales bacterium]